MASVADVMTADVVTLPPDATVSDAAGVMVGGGFGSVIVLQLSLIHI